MIVNSEMAKRIDDSNSIAACPRGEPRSDTGLEATIVMGCSRRNQKGRLSKMAEHGPPETIKAGKPGLEKVITTDAPLCRRGVGFDFNPPETSR
jgi:hypothetical protein